jgi:hypothetical protein
MHEEFFGKNLQVIAARKKLILGLHWEARETSSKEVAWRTSSTSKNPQLKRLRLIATEAKML